MKRSLEKLCGGLLKSFNFSPPTFMLVRRVDVSSVIVIMLYNYAIQYLFVSCPATASLQSYFLLLSRPSLLLVTIFILWV